MYLLCADGSPEGLQHAMEFGFKKRKYNWKNLVVETQKYIVAALILTSIIFV